MYYCTLYRKLSRKATAPYEVVYCLSYDTEAAATAFQNYLLERARVCGASIEEQHNYFYIVGKLSYSISNGFTKIPEGQPFDYYAIGIENIDTQFSLSTEKRGHTEDGLAFEQKMKNYRARLEAERKAEQDKINYNISRFEAEIADKTDLAQILTILIKYAGQKSDKKKLIELTVNKIQGKTAAETSADWYSELSDINN